MSAGYPYLQKLRKSDLTELAEGSDLEEYELPLLFLTCYVYFADRVRVNG